MSRKGKKKCEICDNFFQLSDLYPLAMLRSNQFANAKERFPDLEPSGFICYPDLRKINALHFEKILQKERGSLTELEREVLESIEQHDILSENIETEFERGQTFGQKLSDKIAQFGGSWTFVTLFTCMILVWMMINSFQIMSLDFDPYPYILLNLVLSTLAAIQAPIIMMSQNRQAFKDRLSQENDYQINLKSELQIRQLNTRMDVFMKHYWQRMSDLTVKTEEILTEMQTQKSKF